MGLTVTLVVCAWFLCEKCLGGFKFSQVLFHFPDVDYWSNRKTCTRSIGVCKSPTLFLGSTDWLDILLLVRLPVYWVARTLHHTWDMNTHSPLSVYHLLYSILTPQYPVPLASMSPNLPSQLPQHLRSSPVAPFSPHLKDCPIYSRRLFCFSIFFCRSLTHRSPDFPTFYQYLWFLTRIFAVSPPECVFDTSNEVVR